MSTRTPPIAPRSMLSRASGESIDWDALWEQTFATLSKELYPRLALFEALARFKSRSERRTPSSDEVVETRRAFLDSFAYLCDVQKGGATVTAAGLQKLPESNILWLAANEGVRNDIKIYAENILLKLKNLNPDCEQDAQDEIFRLAVERCSLRIIVYQDEMKRLARNCRMQLKRETQNDAVMSLRRKLRKLSEPPPKMMLTDVVNFCYCMRGLDIDEIKRRSKNALDDYDKLAHYIGRLGATRSSVLAVIKGMMRIPALQQISCIRTVEAPGIKEVALDQWALSPYEVFRGICQDPVSQNPLQNAAALHSLVELDLPSGSADVRVRLSQRRTITTRVHSELQIADRFSRRFLEPEAASIKETKLQIEEYQYKVAARVQEAVRVFRDSFLAIPNHKSGPEEWVEKANNAKRRSDSDDGLDLLPDTRSMTIRSVSGWG
ncbi:hypothetical protein VB005_02449 [Metarhizium brunneum]